MDEELKSYLIAIESRMAAMESRLVKRMDDTEARFMDKLLELETRVMERIRDTEARFVERFQDTEARFAENLHDTETRLLSEFWKWGRASDQRIRRVETSDSSMAERLALAEERIFTLERKIAGLFARPWEERRLSSKSSILPPT